MLLYESLTEIPYDVFSLAFECVMVLLLLDEPMKTPTVFFFRDIPIKNIALTMPDIDPIIIFIGGIINDDIMVAIRQCHSCIDIPIECIGANHMVITV